MKVVGESFAMEPRVHTSTSRTIESNPEITKAPELPEKHPDPRSMELIAITLGPYEAGSCSGYNKWRMDPPFLLLKRESLATVATISDGNLVECD
jgi:hypothetical protein